MDISQLRNVAIIAHIDHGKSTLADRLLELTGTVEKRKMRAQLLDAMELEREKGITIKLTPVRMEYRPGSRHPLSPSGLRGTGQAVGSRDGAAATIASRPLPTAPYLVNLIDTPGHVDFSYEVSRSLAAVEGAILLVDATQGIQAQTLANLELAKRAGLTLVPVVNKIDLPSADVDGTVRELAHLTGVSEDAVLRVSAKTGEGVPDLLAALVERVPAPAAPPDDHLRALVFDSTFDAYQGVIAYVRVVSGEVRRNDLLTFVGSGAEAAALAVGVFRPDPEATGVLGPGEIGYIATGVRDVRWARVGDTLCSRTVRGRVSALPGYAVPQPNVYAGLYPRTGEGFGALRDALGKLQLSDAALALEPEHSPALGQGFRGGFLGLLHLEIVRERLRREFGVEVTVTVPSVAYRVFPTSAAASRAPLTVRSAVEFPDPSVVREVREPWVQVRVLARAADIGSMLQLLTARGSTPPHTETLAGQRLAITAELPLREVVVDFHDDLKAATTGYGSFSLLPAGERPVELAKLTVLVNHQPVEALSVLVPRASAEAEGRRLVERLKTAIPRHLFPVPLQAAVGGKMLARETIPALRKDVTGALYGGDVTRKRKLLEKQKRGKKKLAARGGVTLPPEAYLAVLRKGA